MNLPLVGSASFFGEKVFGVFKCSSIILSTSSLEFLLVGKSSTYFMLSFLFEKDEEDDERLVLEQEDGLIKLNAVDFGVLISCEMNFEPSSACFSGVSIPSSAAASWLFRNASPISILRSFRQFEKATSIQNGKRLGLRRERSPTFQRGVPFLVSDVPEDDVHFRVNCLDHFGNFLPGASASHFGRFIQAAFSSKLFFLFIHEFFCC